MRDQRPITLPRSLRGRRMGQRVDGTLAWDSTVIVMVSVAAGGMNGLRLYLWGG